MKTIKSEFVRRAAIGLTFVVWATVAALSRAESFPSDATSETPAKLNFILILVDDLGVNDVGCNGSSFYETPNIDRLADEGINFKTAYASCAVCSPTRASIQTGLYPARVGITDWIRGKLDADRNPTEYLSDPNWTVDCPPVALFLESSNRTIAQKLKEAGYATGHIGKWHLGDRDHFPDKFGYDRNVGGCQFGQPPSYFNPYFLGTPEKPNAEFIQKNREKTGWKSGFPDDLLPPGTDGEYLTDRERDEAVRFVRENKDRPFFLHLAHYAVHQPLMAKENRIGKFKRKNESGENDSTQKNAVYAAMIESVDESVGVIRKTLEDEGIADRTVLIFTSDNGGLIGPTDNAPWRDGKGSPYEGGLRVPLVVWTPKAIRKGETEETPVISADLFPTIADLAGIADEETARLDGKSFKSLLSPKSSQVSNDSDANDVLKNRSLFWHFPHYRLGYAPYSVIRKGDWKLIKYYATDVNSPKLFELFDLANDPSETNDRADDEPELVRRLEEELLAELQKMNAKLPRPKIELTE